MKRPHTIARRQFLATLGALGLSLPMAQVFREREASAAEPPLRLFIIQTPQGTVHPSWAPRAGFDIAYPGSILAPLAPYKNKMIVIDGLDFKVAYEHGLPVGGHECGMVTCLTGSRIRGTDGGLPDSESVDQAIARHIGNGTKIRSVELLGWKQFSGTTAVNHISFGQGGTRIPMERDPLALYQRLFGDIASGASDQEVARAIARKRSVIDFLKGDASRLESRLVGPERAKLSAHLAALRDIETRLSSVISCTKPAAPTNPGSLDSIELSEQLVKLHLDVMVQAFACDLTRVGSIVLNLPSMPWLDGIGYADIHNDFAHNVDGSEPARQAMVKVHTWYSELIARFIGQLAAVPEGSGTLLDHTLVVWINEIATGSHSLLRVPVVLIGGAGGKLQMGRYLATRDPNADPLLGHEVGDRLPLAYPHNHFLTSLCRLFGLQVDGFGDPDYKGWITGLA
ncbi:MAG: Tat (twin-arginine translocation) pathway signal sequence domain protein [Labilithrix sp.]|nr:Tat (twin-arginine translocation) pathway signal sequence domain protein [Labilithrix sp.]